MKNGAAVARFAEGLVASGLKRVLQFHLTVAGAGVVPGGADAGLSVTRAAAGSAGPLAGAGLVIVNPPYTLKAEAELLLPWLARQLQRDDRASWSSRWLAEE